MKNIKRALALVLCMVMVLAYFPMNVLAADGEPNVYMEVDKTEVNIGDTITVSVNYTDMLVYSFACTLKFDKDLLECVSIEGCDPEYPEDIGLCTRRGFVPGTASSTPAEANGNGQVGFAYGGTKETTYLECTVFIATFTAKAAGVAELVLVEDSAGADSYQGTAGSATVTITGASEHECTPGAVSYKKGENGKHIKVVACAENCGEIYSSTEESCSGGTADCENAAVCEFCGNAYGDANGHGMTNGFLYSHVDGTNTHDVICADCKKTVEENVACTFEEGSHVCKYACGNETDCSDKAGDKDHDCDVCGKSGITQCSGGTATCKDKAVCSECGKEYGDVDANAHIGEKKTEYTDNGANHTVKEFYAGCGHEISSKVADHNYGDDFVCDDCGHALAGWQQKDGAWYYVVDGKPVTGTVRVPYPTAAINGKTYGPNADDVAYSAANADSKYTDEKTAMFMFGDDGKFDYTTNGLVDGGKRYAVDGVIVWHVGLVEVDGVYYYFIGDVNGGGNIAAEGDTYLTRINGIAGFNVKDVYHFAAGKLSGRDGFIDRYNDGKIYYYENSKLMLGAGLTKVGDNYIYVRSNGQIAIGKYWVTNHNGICEPGMYTFDENGYLKSVQDPSFNGLKDGVYYKNGMPYYAGLIEIDGATYYINSAGEAVTGAYYVTKLDNYTGDLDVKRGDKLVFAADGKLVNN